MRSEGVATRGRPAAGDGMTIQRAQRQALACLCILPCLMGTSAPPAASSRDADAVAVQLASTLLPPPERLAAARVVASQLGAALRPNGSWPDIDYHDFRRAEWPMVTHLDRVAQMAAAWRGANASAPVDSGAGQAALLQGVTKALELWLAHDWKDPNPYDQSIGVPRPMGKIALLLSPNASAAGVLPRADVAAIVKILDGARWEGSTGANLLDLLLIQIYRGAFTRDVALLKEAFEHSFAAIARHHQHEESIQVDNSFHQHGPQLQSGGYGACFTRDLLIVVTASVGTAFEMAPATASLFESYVLDGQAPMSRGASFDWQVRGRGISVPPGGNSSRRSDTKVRESMAVGFPPEQLRLFGATISRARKHDWNRLARRLETDDASPAAALVGNFAFFDSDYVAHNRPEFFFSVHMFSKRTISAACVNGQGKPDRHLGDGATSLLITGHEYDGIFPVWNWSHPPGTTVATASVAPTCANARHSTDATFVGAVSDGKHGVALQNLELGVPTATPPSPKPANISNCSGVASGQPGTTGSLSCAMSCGTCSGSGCWSRPGGATSCCGSHIKRTCSASVGPPCRFGPPPAPQASANKTWLMFDNVIIASGDADAPQSGGLVTAIEQSRLQGVVVVGQAGPTFAAAGKRLPPGSSLTLNLSGSGAWVWHHNTGYILPQTPGATLHVSNANRSGTWSALGVGAAGVPDRVDLPVFDLHIEHRAAYRYMVLPATARLGDMSDLLANHSGYVVVGGGRSGFTAATRSHRSPAEADVALGAVWSRAGVELRMGCWAVRASRECAFALQRWPNGTVRASASIPGVDGGDLILRVRDSCANAPRHAGESVRVPGCTRLGGGLLLNLTMRSGDYSGSSTTVVCG